MAAYKERKISSGVYAVRCLATGDVWVGTAPDLSTIQNRLWFQLKLNASPHRHLQAAWNTHGADSITFEALERLDDDVLAYARQAALKKCAQRWSKTLNATTL